MKIKKRGGKNWNWWDCGAKNEFNSGQFFFFFFFYLNFFVFFSAKEADKSLYFTLGPRKKCCCKETKKNERDQTRKAHDPADAAVVGSEKVCRPKNRFQLQDEWIEGKERIGKNRGKKKAKKKIGRCSNFEDLNSFVGDFRWRHKMPKTWNWPVASFERV